jgi:hypothetical protein
LGDFFFFFSYYRYREDNMTSPPPIPRPSAESLALLEGVIAALFPEFDYSISTRRKSGLRSRTHKAIATVRDDLASGQAYIQTTGPGEYHVWNYPGRDHYNVVHLSDTSGHEHTCSCWDTASKGLCYHIIAASIKLTLCTLAQQPLLFALAPTQGTPPAGRSRKKKPAAPPTPARPAPPIPRPSASIPTLEAPRTRRGIPLTDEEIPF